VSHMLTIRQLAREKLWGDVMRELSHRGGAGFLLVITLLALFFLEATGTATEPQISADGWRPKRQTIPPAGDAEGEVVAVADHPTLTPQQTPPSKQDEPFDWQDDLSGVSASDQQPSAVVINSVAGPAPSSPRQNTACDWCQCQQSDPRLCGHCGLPRPVQAAYRSTLPTLNNLQRLLVDDNPMVPALDRIRLAMEHVNDRVQQTLGQF
jgi:hypothetical protein